MNELDAALDLLKREITKHDIDLHRAYARNGVREEEIQRLRDKIAQKRLLMTTIREQSRALESYRRLLREKLVEIKELKTQLAMLTKGADADGQNGLDGRADKHLL